MPIQNMAALLCLFLALYVSVFVHEFGHIIAYLRFGVKIQEIKVGFLKFKFGSKSESVEKFGTAIYAGYVWPTQDGSQKYSTLSIKQRDMVNGSGCLANVIFAICVEIVRFALLGEAQYAVLMFVVLIVVLFKYEYIYRFILPTISMSFLIIFVCFVFHGEFAKIVIDRLFPEIWQHFEGIIIFQNKMPYYLRLLSLVSIFSAIVNAMPLKPTDGYRILKRHIRQRSVLMEKVYEKVSSLLLPVCLVYSMVLVLLMIL